MHESNASCSCWGAPTVFLTLMKLHSFVAALRLALAHAFGGLTHNAHQDSSGSAGVSAPLPVFERPGDQEILSSRTGAGADVFRVSSDVLTFTAATSGSVLARLYGV